MDLVQILQHSISAFIFVVPGVLLYFIIAAIFGKSQKVAHVIASLVFCYYLIGVLSITGIGEFKSFTPQIALIPFINVKYSPTETLLNIVLFVPFGVFLPLMYRQKYNKFKNSL